ncbi:MAG: hypothetical protein MJD61_03240 [Proteobacteria bacterium]|nr:hypothetical protein [Pseudomonadota bacterium]
MMAKKRAGRPRTKTPHAREEQLHEALSSALSREERERVLACALFALDEAGLERLTKGLGSETGPAVRAVLQSSVGTSPERGPSKARVKQDWDEAWGEWEGRVAEASYEEGDYVQQDEHWEPPYLDTYTLTKDLEAIAARVRPLIPRILDDQLDPDFSFAATLLQAAQEVGSGLPEWMEGWEPLDFGPQVTTGLLEWEWRVAQQRGLAAFRILEGIRELDASLEDAGLDDEAIGRFVLALDEVDQKGILQGIDAHRSKGPWDVLLEHVHSGWFRMYQELARKWEPPLFEATSLANIANDWRLALPLVKTRLKKKQFVEALTLIDEAVRTLLRLKPGESWDPREGLLVRHCEVRHRIDGNDARVRLLKAWQKAAAGLGREDLSCALELQSTIAAKWEDWDAVLGAFQRLEQPRFKAMCDLLFGEWRTLVAESSVRVGWDGDEQRELGWLHALADAARVGNDNESFHRSVRSWLQSVASAPDLLERARYSLTTLTLDLDHDGELKRTTPTLRRLLSHDQDRTRRLDRARRQWILRLRGKELFPEVIEFWRRNTARLVPDPAQVHGSNYDDCADWMVALRELNPESYATVVHSWSDTHKRRRNLWRAFDERGLHRSE